MTIIMETSASPGLGPPIRPTRTQRWRGMGGTVTPTSLAGVTQVRFDDRNLLLGLLHLDRAFHNVREHGLLASGFEALLEGPARDAPLSVAERVEYPLRIAGKPEVLGLAHEAFPVDERRAVRECAVGLAWRAEVGLQEPPEVPLLLQRSGNSTPHLRDGALQDADFLGATSLTASPSFPGAAPSLVPVAAFSVTAFSSNGLGVCFDSAALTLFPRRAEDPVAEIVLGGDASSIRTLSQQVALSKTLHLAPMPLSRQPGAVGRAASRRAPGGGEVRPADGGAR
eukprot:CAMPEP_0204568234 /NCGR_PEP_ID=MMETSP0661-20131031/37064_1 /ASSEMBLY_ACC=CAM_ASM_000606 /TAXON_ID=109239 /ORGANISM="Alexandrium margalefi, Strain AMGDE01CS-322" /LENGTH=282 /DNA_ID=CAMNT_0051576229 /DNA_START=16 /DNA_END=861 /DNA_ORIENTATION=-